MVKDRTGDTKESWTVVELRGIERWWYNTA